VCKGAEDVDPSSAPSRFLDVEPSPRPDQRGNPVYEDEVAKMIGAEMCFKAVNRVAKWRRHHSSICDNNIERFPLRQQLVSTDPHHIKVSEIQSDERENSAISRSVFSHLDRRSFGFCQVPRCTHDVCTMRSKGPRSLHANACRDSRNENSFTLQTNTGQNLFGCRSHIKYVCHPDSPVYR